jgi:hypothetical protein
MKRKVGKSQYAGIPANERKGVRAMMGVWLGAGHQPLTPAAAYQKILEGRKAIAREEAAKVAKREKENKRQTREHALKALLPVIYKFTTIRDVLRGMAEGRNITDSPQDSSMMCHATLMEAASELEQALFDLGLIEGDVQPWGTEGLFVGMLARNSEGGESNAA